MKRTELPEVEDLGVACATIGSPLPDDAIAKLLAFEELLTERALPIGLIAEGDRDAVRRRHVLDCLRAVPHVPAGRVADLGSGAGLPGIVVAIARRDLRVDLVEPQRRRLAFLELALERLALPNAAAVGVRAEELPTAYDGALARAFADARASWMAAEPILVADGRLVYFAGARFNPVELARPAPSGPAASRWPEPHISVVPPPPLLASSGPLVIMTRQ